MRTHSKPHFLALEQCEHTPCLAFRHWSNANTLQASLSGVGAMRTDSGLAFRRWSNANTLQASLSGVGAMRTHSKPRFPALEQCEHTPSLASGKDAVNRCLEFEALVHSDPPSWQQHWRSLRAWVHEDLPPWQRHVELSGAVNTQGFVWKFLCDIYKFSFIRAWFHEAIPPWSRLRACVHLDLPSRQQRFRVVFGLELTWTCLYDNNVGAVFGPEFTTTTLELFPGLSSLGSTFMAITLELSSGLCKGSGIR